MRVRLAGLLAALIVASSAQAHNIEGDVRVEAYLKPEGHVLHIVLRAPLKAMRDVEFPRGKAGFLDVEHAEPALRSAVSKWITSSVALYESGSRTGPPAIAGVRASPESDRSFVAYRDALEHILGPASQKPASQTTDSSLGDTPVDKLMLDVAIEYPIHSASSDFQIRPGFERLGMKVVTVLWFLPPSGTIRAFEYAGDAGLVHLDPSWHQAALTFVRLGFLHILDGTDHLLFLFCLVIPFRKLQQLLWIVTSFTVAHSITLIASAFNLAPGAAWFPPLIEVLIALSILYMAIENIAGVKSVHHRWTITFGFGLVHGFGFSFALHETLQFAGSHLVTSLLAFNAGVELGQILVLAILVPALVILFRFVVAERTGTIALSAVVALIASAWMIERWAALRPFLFF